MPTSKIYLTHTEPKDGYVDELQDIEVSIAFSPFDYARGQISSARTDKFGVARIEHEETGLATVMINHSPRASFRAPGMIEIYI